MNLLYILRCVGKAQLDEARRQSFECYLKCCAKNDPLVNNINQWRNNIFAHYNRQVALGGREDFWSKVPLDLPGCQNLIDRAFQILEWSSVVLGRPRIYQKFADGKDSYQIVLDALRLKS